jgi:Secretion system C-terminal sorting domain
MLKFLLLIGLTLTGCLDSSSAIARSILTAEGFAHYPPILQLTETTGERSVAEPETKKFQYLYASPNPADQQVSITVRGLNSNVERCTLQISDAGGIVVSKHSFVAGQQATDWRTSHLTPGIYFAQLIVDGNHRDELKIVVQR